MTPDPHWMDNAACRDSDPLIFFPLGPGDHTAEAAQVCATCPVKTECFDDAMRQRDYHGYRGGMSGEARRRLAAAKNRVDVAEQVQRLTERRWTPQAIALRLGVDVSRVYRELKEQRDGVVA